MELGYASVCFFMCVRAHERVRLFVNKDVVVVAVVLTCGLVKMLFLGIVRYARIHFAARQKWPRRTCWASALAPSSRLAVRRADFFANAPN